MIDIKCETVVSLNEAAKHSFLPRRRAGKRPHVSTLYRWSKQGCNGIVLETIRFGGTICTSIEAIQRFAESLTQQDHMPRSNVVPTKASQQANEDLAQLEF